MAEERLDPAAGGGTARERLLRARHEAAYRFARRLADGATVVDVACGVGYGARVLGEAPAGYAGVDRSREALRTARSRAPGGRRGFVRGDVVGGIPLRSGCADLVLAFQIIEHVPVPETPGFVSELARLCAPGARVVLTTPNRRHRLFPFQSPWNPFHTREFDRAGLAEVLGTAWGEVAIRGLRADEEVERLELTRVRRRKLASLAGPLVRRLPGGLRSWLAERVGPGARGGSGGRGGSGDGGGGGGAGPLRTDRITADRFRVVDDPEGRGLDLVAVCRP